MNNIWQYVFFCHGEPWYKSGLPRLGREGSPLITFKEEPQLHVSMCESLRCGGIRGLRQDFGEVFGELEAFIAIPLPEEADELDTVVNFASFADVIQALDQVCDIYPDTLSAKALAKKVAPKTPPKTRTRRRP